MDESLLDLLACPATHHPLRLAETGAELICTGCGLAFPIRDDIPVLLLDEARPTSPAAGAAGGAEGAAGDG